MMAKTQPEISQNWTAISGSDHRLVGRCESATMASAASSVIGFPLSRLWIVMRETPRSLATSVGVPMASLIALYSAAVMLASVGWSKGLDGANELAVLVNLDDLRLERAGGFDEVVGLGFGFLDGSGGECGAVETDFVGVHGGGCFGVGRAQWRRGERKIDLLAPQELSVKYFYAPFRPANEKEQAPT